MLVSARSSLRGLSAARPFGSRVAPRCYATQRAHAAAAQHQARCWVSRQGLLPGQEQALWGCSKRRGSTLCRATGSDDEGSGTVELDIKVEGMMCGGCTARVEEALKAAPRVRGVAVDLDSKLASVEVEAASLMDAVALLPGLVQSIKDLGFEAEPHIDYQS
ncbi:hypothetical protein Rsub_02008 [Raphidocelis subcapitata]|uniref:HMA domain-containing protein n=1 Tax=Raphidocelis subcapitata TaxID=307507 RepID=A0A2V0NPB8_9CHLO|nr:hypothetical protein Rsub_02008 [Raphidocelis subcapitata]|eukprot:GBF89436.1 hypothetical protein Rsub_02008 [Raphidocelis subcapitata]